MHNVLFAVSALAGVAGFALLRWSASRGTPAAPVTPEPPPEPPPPPVERSTVPKPLRITVFVKQTDREPDGGRRITLPLALLKDDHRPTTPTTYLVESVEVEVNDFFDGFTTKPRHDLGHCDVVVRGGGNHTGAGARHVITRAAMPLAVLVEDDEDLVEACGRALEDPTRRQAFEERIVEVVREGAVLGWLERHEQALAQPPDHGKWPFVFEQQEAEGDARRS